MPRPMLFVALAALAVPAAAPCVVLGQLDDFEDGSTQGWRHGAVSPNPPTNVPGGGPGGAEDAYLRVTATGSFSPGGRLIAYNEQQWTGSYVDAGVDLIRADVRNPGGAALPMRVAIQSTTTRYVSSDPVLVPGDAQWHEAIFDLTQMTNIGGSETLEETLANVQFLRVLVAEFPAWQGDPIDAEFGIDNIEARSSVVDVDLPSPPVVSVLAAHPNPFLEVPTLEIGLDVANRITVDVFDVAGRLATSQHVGLLAPGGQGVRLEAARNLAPGVWLFRIRTPEATLGTVRAIKVD